MKSKLLFGFAVIAAFTAVLLSGCGTSSSSTTTCIDINGDQDSGVHKIYLGTVYGGSLGIPDIHDTLSATITGSAAVIHDNALQRNLTGTVNCGSIALDSVIFGAGDTLVINSSTLGRVTIWDVRAGGSGTIVSETSVTTSIKIGKGHTNLSVLPNLSNVELRGTFAKF